MIFSVFVFLGNTRVDRLRYKFSLCKDAIDMVLERPLNLPHGLLDAPDRREIGRDQYATLDDELPHQVATIMTVPLSQAEGVVRERDLAQFELRDQEQDLICGGSRIHEDVLYLAGFLWGPGTAHCIVYKMLQLQEGPCEAEILFQGLGVEHERFLQFFGAPFFVDHRLDHLEAHTYQGADHGCWCQLWDPAIQKRFHLFFLFLFFFLPFFSEKRKAAGRKRGKGGGKRAV